MDLWLFVKVLGRHWWALLSCAAFTGIGVYAAWSGKGNHWIVDASGVAALFLLIVAAFLAWNDEHLKAEVHQAPEVMLSYRYEAGLTEHEPIRVRNTGGGTAFKVDVDVVDDSFRPFFEAIPYLAERDEVPLSQRAITDNNHVALGSISLGRDFLTYLRMLKNEADEFGQLVFRIVTVSYANEHGVRFAQDFRASYNVVTEDSKMFPYSPRRRLAATPLTANEVP